MPNISVYLPQDVLDALKAHAEEVARSRSDALVQILREKLIKKNGGKK